MKFIADFHVHSKFSIATAKNLDLENLYIAAQLKGIKVVGTGDFTHPGWFSEIKEKLVPAEEGLFKLKEAISSKCDAHVPPSCRDQVRFILVSEISNIYKKKNKTRKNHNLVFVPDLSIVERFNKKLEKIGNIKSDGRPILGLDARNLFEILLETSEQNYLIPAHIWTPWFSILGSKSGFDSIDECFEDLTHQIFAIETGLSSDPPMNRRVSALDGLTLVSNSDAHSPLKVGREANIFDTELSYSAIKSAIKSGDPKRFLGTFEFFPEEGKYHLDGHRKCNVRLNPKESMKQGGKCPVCGKPLTLGVLYRVEELSDRAEGATPQKKHPFYSIVPLTEILAEIFRVGSGSKKVQQGYHGLLDKLGPEFEILHSLKTQTIDKSGVPLLGEAIRRMRAKEIFINPGYDGEFGKIKIFKEDEREKLLGQKSLFVLPASDSFKKNKKTTCDARLKKGKKHQKFIKKHSLTTTASKSREKGILFGELNEEQRKAVLYNDGPLLIVAGPGTGKTRTLTHKVAYLVCQEKVSSEQVLAMTFTNKAAQEMRDRLRSMMPDSEPLPRASTFHSFCLEILKTHEGVNISKFSGIIDENDRKTLILEAVKKVEKNGVKITKPPLFFLDRVIAAKQMLRGLTDNFKTIVDNSETEMFSAVYASYQLLLEIQGLYDYEDLIFKVVGLFEKNKAVRRKYQEQYRYVLVDEYQDLNYGQYRIVQTLVPPEKPHQNLCVIGDPDQSIYGFRGSDVKYFKRFLREYPKTKVIRLTRNYRSTETILEASHQVINNYSTSSSESRIYSGINGVRTIGVLEANTAKGEAVAVGKMIEKLVGGIGFHSIDFNKVDDENHEGSRGEP
ncbi:MAG: UvrD-helicase domain-containing protein [Deltaproteobacteria bacterium]|nr:UvrD-helicase domain-containing protein [Deltaproteobacteria bacterium]